MKTIKFFLFQTDFSESGKRTIQGMELAEVVKLWEGGVKFLTFMHNLLLKGVKVRIHSLREVHNLWTSKL